MNNSYKYHIEIVREETFPYEWEVMKPKNAVEVSNTIFGLGNRASEIVVVLDVDAKNELIGMQEVAVGTLSSAVFDMRNVFRGAILNNARGIIVLHNHPSGSLNISEEDELAKEKMRHAGKLLDIEVLDFIVVAGEEYMSMRGERKW